MKKIKARWRLHLNFLILGLLLITTFQNCSENKINSTIRTTPLGLEVITE